MDLGTRETGTFIELAFDRMLEKARLLADDVAVEPDLVGSNSVYALVVHCVGVVDFWFDHVVSGNETTRDRESEFVAVGAVADLEALVGDLRGRLPGLLAAISLADEPAGAELDFERPWPWTVGAVVLHVIEELFQHAGHVDITTDLVLGDRVDPT